MRAKEDPRVNIVCLKLSRTEKKRLKELADVAGMSVSEYIRSRIFNS